MAEIKSGKQWSEDTRAVMIGSVIIAAILVAAFTGVETFRTPVFKWKNTEELFGKVLSLSNLTVMLTIGLVFLLLAALSVSRSGGKPLVFPAGFSVLYLLALTGLIIGGNTTISEYGIEYVIFTLILGIILNNFFKLPAWIKDAARSEFFIKTGLVILGSSVLFTDIIKAGIPGIVQALLVVAVVWFFSLWLCRRMKVDDEFGVILASAVSICGVSAAIVAAGAIQGDKKKLSYITTLVLLVAIPMLILQPWIIKSFQIPELVGGAWLGGTLDTTASVTAAAEIVGPQALKVGVIIKFSQNVLIGVAAFLIASWWVLRRNNSEAASEKPSFNTVWERFPKFVLGFIVVSLLFSFAIPPSTGKQVSGMLNSLRSVWFALAFVSIGIEARFSDLVKHQGTRPAVAFVSAQLFNIIWTLIIAYLLFGGILFPVPSLGL